MSSALRLGLGAQAIRRPAPTALHRASSARAFHASMRRREQFLDADQKTLENAVSAERSKDRLVLVDFYADWCGPCMMLSPILEKLSADASVKSGSGRAVDLVTVDTDEHGALAQSYSVQALPTVVAFVDGEPVARFVGARPEPAVRSFIGEL